MKYISKKNQDEVKKLVEQVMIILRSHIIKTEVVGKGYDALSQIVRATHSREDYLEWLMWQVANDVDYKYSRKAMKEGGEK